MKLLYFVQYFPPETAAGLSLVNDLIEGFARLGIDVTVYTPTPTRGVSDKIRKEYKNNKKVIIKENGKLVIRRLPLYREGKSFLQRAIRYTIFTVECIIKGLFIPADAIFLSSGPPTQAIAVAILRKLTPKRIIYNLQDVFPDSLVNAGLFQEKSLFVKVGRWMERLSYNNAHAVITVSEDMLNNIIRKGVDRYKVFMIRNWIDTNVIKHINRSGNRLFDDLKLNRNKFYVIYSGNIGYTMGLEYLIKAAEYVQSNRNIKFLIFGEGSDKQKLVSYVKDHNIKNVSFFPFQDADKISEVYSMGDLAVISGKSGLSGISMPSKTWTIMAAGTGILAQFDLNSELARIIREANCGVITKPEDAKELARIIEKLSNDRKKCEMYGVNARNYAENKISKDKAISEYARIIKG